MTRLFQTLALVALACAALAPAAGAQTVVLTPFVSGLATPVGMEPVPDDATRLVVVQQGGQLRVIENGGLLTTPALNVSSLISTGSERGLLGLAFHPAWPDSAYIYLNYTRSGNGATVIARYTRSSAAPLTFNPASARILLTVAQPFSNHNGGQTSFGPDGYLYVAFGDGGSGGDPNGSGQNLNDILGSIIRIDVDGGGQAPDCGGTGALYTIPADNPFNSTASACNEIYTYGMRNPWRFSFDRANGRLWVADVGQGAYEEVDTLVAGGNYGWNTMEGFHCYNATTCNQTGLRLPVYEYARAQGFSVTGGYVYRGTRIPDLVGKYVFGDLGGPIRALNLASGTPVVTALGTVGQAANCQFGYCLSSFGQDVAGELYAVTLGGTIYRIDPFPVAAEAAPETAGLAFTLEGASPARDRAAFTFTAPTAGPARLVLLDALGREVARAFDGTVAAGAPTRATLDVSGLAPGVYLAHLTTADGARTLRLTVTR